LYKSKYLLFLVIILAVFGEIYTDIGLELAAGLDVRIYTSFIISGEIFIRVFEL